MAWQGVLAHLACSHDQDSALGLEAWFYVLCYAQERRSEAIRHLRPYINAGARSHGWYCGLEGFFVGGGGCMLLH
jgi:hypothetical protein